jgi:putative drug exporter of the RND superfamily
MVLVPAFMHVMGRWNWWAPKPLAWIHDRIGISEGPTSVEPAEAVQDIGLDDQVVGTPVTHHG